MPDTPDGIGPLNRLWSKHSVFSAGSLEILDPPAMTMVMNAVGDSDGHGVREQNKSEGWCMRQQAARVSW